MTSYVNTASNSYDESLRAFMLSLYNHTAAGLGLSGVVAYLTYASGLMTAMGPLMWLFIFAPLGMLFFWTFAGQNWGYTGTRNFYYAFTAVTGVSLSTIFVVYSAISIAQVFFITAAVFASASLYGYTTKRDISGWGSFLFVGLIGIILAMIVNIFLGSNALGFAISIIGVIVFTGLTAYDTQEAKSAFLHGGMSTDEARVYALTVALSLYLNFINLFQFLLSLLGSE